MAASSASSKSTDPLRKGIAAAQSGRRADAFALLSRVVRDRPRYVVAWLWLASVAASRRDARKILEKVLLLQPGHPKAVSWLSRLDQLERSQAEPKPQGPRSDAAPTARVDEPESAPVRPLILVVDDSPTLCKILSLSLEKAGYRVLVARDGMRALAYLAETVPDLILLDIEMPNLDGYKVCRVIKQNARTHSVPVLMVTGREGILDKVRSHLVGACGFLIKPVEVPALLRAVKARLPR